MRIFFPRRNIRHPAQSVMPKALFIPKVATSRHLEKPWNTKAPNDPPDTRKTGIFARRCQYTKLPELTLFFTPEYFQIMERDRCLAAHFSLLPLKFEHEITERVFFHSRTFDSALNLARIPEPVPDECRKVHESESKSTV